MNKYMNKYMNRIKTVSRVALSASMLSAFCAPAISYAQQGDSTVLAPVVVTATRIPTAASSLTQPVTVLLGQDLRARGVTTVAEALRSVPGASVVQSGSFGAVTSLFLRGGESRYTKVLIDGVPVNAVGGAFFFQNLTLDNVERIEVVEGPGSALYGADALTGVIQIFTRQGGGRGTLDASARAGSYGTREGSASLSGGIPSADYTLGAGWHQTDGVIRFNNQYSTGTLSGALRLAAGARSVVRLTSRYSSSIYHFPTDFSGVPNDTNSYTSQHRLVLGADASHALTSAVTLRLLAGDNEVHDLSEDTRAQKAGGFVKTSAPATGYRRRLDARVEAATGPRATLTLGSDYEMEAERAKVVSYNYTTSPDGVTGDIVPGGDDHRITRGYYAAAQGVPLPRVSYDASARYDNHSDYKDVTTYHAGAAVELWNGVRVRGSYGTGFNAPAFYQTQGSAYNRANSALQPEQVHTLDIGLEQSLLSGKLHASVAAFDQHFSQLIQYVPGLNGGPPAYAEITPAYYDNLTQARARGYQASAQLALGRAWSASLNYTQLLAHVYAVPADFGGSLKPGDALLRRPSHSGSGLVSYAAKAGWFASLNATYVGKRPDMDFAVFPSPTVTLPAYVKLDLAGSVDLLRTASRTLALTARVDNALDRPYEDVLHFPAPRRTVLIGGRIAAIQ
ncbi:MAG: TonB-dependent receptor plug domain-containing protein [Gemmatimonadaceae bacterium]